MEETKEFITYLTEIRMALANLDQADTNAIAQIGAKLEDVITQIPESLTKITSLLEVCLEALQTIYQQIAKNK